MQKNKTIESVNNKIAGIFSHPSYTDQKRMDLLLMLFSQERKQWEKENIILKSDINRAIGRMRGLGYPDEYLEKKYNG